MYDDVNKLQIPLKLDGIFLYFPTQAFTLEGMQRCDEIKMCFYCLMLKLGIPILRYTL